MPGFLRAKSGSVWPAVALHFINNAVSELLSALARGTSDAVAQTVQLVYFSVSLLLTAVGIVWLEKRDRDAWKLEPFSEDISFWRRCGWFFSSPMIIIFLLIALGEAIYFFL